MNARGATRTCRIFAFTLVTLLFYSQSSRDQRVPGKAYGNRRMRCKSLQAHSGRQSECKSESAKDDLAALGPVAAQVMTAEM